MGYLKYKILSHTHIFFLCDNFNLNYRHLLVKFSVSKLVDLTRWKKGKMFNVQYFGNDVYMYIITEYFYVIQLTIIV